MNHRSSLAIENWLLERLAEQIGTAPEGIDPGARFSDLGLDSAASAALLADFATTTGRVCAPTLVWDHPTPAALARHLAGEGVSTRERPAERAHAAPAAAALADDAIAIIGMACRLPGADDPESFWRLLLAGRETVAEVPIGRRDAVAESSRPARGGFLEQVDRFDAAFFAISPREARQIDPQQRLMLELAWEAMEDAGLVVDRLRGSATGVFLGAMWSDYSRLPQMTLGAMTQHTAVGQDSSAIPGRIAYTFGFEGPSLAVNTACSSSLVAVHLACQSLRSGESTLALAGGVNLILAPESTVAMAEFGGLSPEGRCKAFAAAADGYVRGEGGGVVVLKPLTQARLDGDPIHAVVHGSWVNNDGYSNGLTAPNPQAQEALLRRAYERAGVDPTAVQYVEAHGTGTHLGDPIEAQALGETLGTGRAADQPLRIGSVKSNIGHLEAAAGVAGLLKTLLAIRHRRLPASLHCDEPNPAIPFDALGLEVQRQVGAWPRPQSVPVAGVSSFGFTGTNCHVVVGADAAPRSLFDRAESLAPGDAVRPVFVFSGTGAQWPGMALQLLLHEPLFRTAVQRCDRSLRRFVRWSLVAVLAGRPGARPLLDTEVTQFAIFAVQLGLCAVWRQWGVVPRAVVGHSVGEIAAAHVAGVLDLDEAIEILYHRSRLQERLAGEGGMALVELDAETLGPTLSDEVDIGCLNSPGSTVLSGPNEALAAEVERLRARGVRVHPVQIGFAAHSKATEPLAEELAVQLRRLQPRPGRISFVSTVTGKPVAGEALDAAYWASNVRQPVRFATAIESLLAEGSDVFLEIGPHPVLERSILESLPPAGHAAVQAQVLISMRRDQDESDVLLETLATLRRLGAPAPTSAGQTRTELAEAPRLVPISAHSPAALSARARSWLGWLRQVPDEGRPASFMADLGHTTAVRRAHHAHRRGLLCTSLTDLERRLQEVADGPPARGSSRLRPGTRQRLVLVFPGQGSQWPGMGRDLLTSEPAFRRQMERCDAVIRRLEGWSILDRLAAGEEVAASASIARIQPLLFALQVSLAALWRHWGIEPDAVIGHSMGEVAAAQVAGALSLEDAARVICRRSHLLERLSGDGGMLLAEGTAEEAEAWVAEAPEPVSLAAINGPRSTVLSGPPAALDAMAARLEGRGVYHRRIRVDVASHSPQVEPLARPLLQDLAAIEPSAGTVPIYSTVSATVVSGAELDAEYWQRNLRQPVRFWPVIERLVESGHDTFVEVSPHPSLGSSVEDGLRSTGSPGLVVGSLRREENGRSAMLESLGQLYEAGHPVRWQALHGDGRPLALPTYPWQRQRFWLEEVAGRRTTQPAAEFGASADAHAALYEVVWRQASTGPQPVPAASGGWLILADRTGLAETLAENLAAPRVVVLAGGSFEALGDDRYRLDPAAPEQFERLLEVPVVRRCHHVLYLWSLDVDAAADAASGTAAERTWLGVLHLVQALVSVDSPPRLWLVTRGAQAVDPVSPASLNQAALWGLARVVAAEHPELRTTRIDLGPPTGAKMEAASAEVTALAAELTEARLTEIQRPSEVALRDGQRSTPHLQPVGESGRPIPIRRRASYLITGGLGSLGLEVAAWLVEQGARHLVLLGRHGPGPSAEQRIAALEERGAQVVTASADVARAEDLERAVDLALRDLPPLAGLVHAAGVIDDGSIRSQDAERCRRVMAPKVLGAANLHRLTLGLELDFFVLFSSVASLLGLPGQPAYAAANAGLDHLAHQRRAQGLPATSIHWSGWSGLGFAASEGGRNILAYLARQGLGSLTQDEALRALGRALTVGSPAEIAVLRIDTETYTEFHRQARGNPLLATLGGKGEPSVAAADSEDLRQRLTAIASPQRRRAELESYLQQQAAAVLGLEPSRVGRDDAMRDLGMGSLMAVELRSRLEEGTGLTLSTTLVFSQPTVRQLAAYLGAEMGLGLGGVRAEGEPTEHDRPEPSNGAAEAELDDLLRQVETLSPEALDELLQGRDDGSWADPRAESGEAPETRTRPRTPGVVR